MSTRQTNRQIHQQRHSAFTLIELLVVMAIISLLMSILTPSLRAAKEQSRQVVCLSNIRQLTIGWQIYAMENDDGIVSARTEPSGWMGEDIYKPTKKEKLEEMRRSVFWSYCETPDVYRCPKRIDNVMRTYSPVDSMNGFRGVPNTSGLILTQTSQISSPGTRAIFIDEGIPTPHSYTIYYDQPQWWDWVSTQHDFGTTFSFGDGHCDYKKWKNYQTINYTRQHSPHPISVSQPLQYDNQDVIDCIKLVWGRVGF